MSTIFRVKNSDRRKELIKAFDGKEVFRTQKPTGSDVEYFSADTGFVLLEKLKYLDLALFSIQQK